MSKRRPSEETARMVLWYVACFLLGFTALQLCGCTPSKVIKKPVESKATVILQDAAPEPPQVPEEVKKKIREKVTQDQVKLTRDQWVIVRIGQERRKLRIKQLKRQNKLCKEKCRKNIARERKKRILDSQRWIAKMKKKDRERVIAWVVAGIAVTAAILGTLGGIYVGRSMPRQSSSKQPLHSAR